MTSPLENCPNHRKDRKASIAHLEDCVESLREAQSHLVAHLRSILRELLSEDWPPRAQRQRTQECLRHLRETDKAYELSKQAEAKFETLISHLSS
jgi:hypothetical protein